MRLRRQEVAAAGRRRESNYTVVVFSVFHGHSVIRIGEETAQRCMHVVKRRKFFPVAVVEGIGSLVSEEKAGRVNVGTVRRAIAAYVAGALGVTPVVAFDEVGFNRRPYDAAVET